MRAEREARLSAAVLVMNPHSKHTVESALAELGQTWRFETGLRLITGLDNYSPMEGSKRELRPSWVLKLPVRFDIQPGSNIAGQWLDRGAIRLHPALTTPAFQRKLVETFFHELAHAIDSGLGVDSHHGEHWQWVFSCFGFVPHRCHTLDLRHQHLEELDI